MKSLSRFVPILAVVGCGAWLVSRAPLPRDAAGEMAMYAFGRLPVAYQGRVKPFDTLARNSLVIISNRQTYRDENGAKQPAIRWLLDVISGSEAAMKHRVFRIPNLELIDVLQLPKHEHYRYAYEEFQNSLPALDEEIGRVQAMEPSQRDVYDTQLLEFYKKVHLFNLLVKAHQLPALPSDHDQLVPALKELISEYRFLEQSPLPYAIPPMSDKEQWRPLMRAAIESMIAQNPNPAIAPLATMLDAWRAGDAVGFNSALAGYQSILAEHPPAKPSTLDFEVFFNHLEPITKAYGISVDYSKVPNNTVVGPLLEAELYAIILNLLSNSIKSVIAAGGEKIVSISANVVEKKNVICIRDTGIGLDPANYDDVFIPFVADPEGKLYGRLETKLNSQDKYIVGSGSGLGLSIVKEIIENRKGSIRFCTPDGKWKAKVEVVLP